MSSRTPFGQPANHQVIIDLTGDNENETENIAVSASPFCVLSPFVFALPHTSRRPAKSF
jgi:hypothetical protein